MIRESPACTLERASPELLRPKEHNKSTVYSILLRIACGVQGGPGPVACEAIMREQNVVSLMAQSVHSLRKEYGQLITDEFVSLGLHCKLGNRLRSKFLDDFLLHLALGW